MHRIKIIASRLVSFTAFTAPAPILATILILTTFAPAVAQDADESGAVVTRSELLALKERVDEALKAEDCEAALKVLPEFVDKANTHANMIYAGAKAALREDSRFMFGDAIRKQLIAPLNYRDAALRERNAGYVSIGDCMVKVGQPYAASGAYLKALELVNAEDERDTWNRARLGLWKLIGVTTE